MVGPRASEFGRVVADGSMNSHTQRAIERCPTKNVFSREDAITQAIKHGFPVVPYKCPNGWDHWHVGKAVRKAKVFYNNRPKWETQWINKPSTVPGDS